jgi:MFS family permease
MLRIVLGILAGIAAGVLVFLAIAYLGDLLFPMPAEVDANDPEQVTSAFSSAPLAAKLMLLAALFGGALAGALVADRLALRRWAGWPIALLLTVFAVGVAFLVALPAWMQIALIVAPLAGAVMAAHGLRRPSVGRG